ncbi:hypothetical protein J6590_055991 [Homalodisca vitripennis]|nr:hypothetical protein J6590_055991 [Homalodisca vitripennis]
MHTPSCFVDPELNREATTKSESEQANGFIEKTPIYVTAYPPSQTTNSTSTSSSASAVVKPAAAVTSPSSSQTPPPTSTQDLELTQELAQEPPPPSPSPFPNGRTEVLIGQDASAVNDTKVKTTAIVENHRGLSVSDDTSARPLIERRGAARHGVVRHLATEAHSLWSDHFVTKRLMAKCNGPMDGKAGRVGWG